MLSALRAKHLGVEALLQVHNHGVHRIPVEGQEGVVVCQRDNAQMHLLCAQPCTGIPAYRKNSGPACRHRCWKIRFLMAFMGSQLKARKVLLSARESMHGWTSSALSHALGYLQAWCDQLAAFCKADMPER